MSRHPSLRPKPGAPGLRRSKPLNPIGRKAEERYQLQFNGWHAERLRRRDCDGLPDGSHAEGCSIAPHLNRLRGDGKNDPSHVQKRGRGGLFWTIVTHSRECHSTFEQLPADERLRMLPLAHRLAWQSHNSCPDLVPAPPVPEGEETP